MSNNDTGAPVGTKGQPATHEMAGEGRVALMGILAVQAVIGYEWLVSGITKVFGNFVATFGDELPAVSTNAPDWFKSILESIVAPAPAVWGALIMVGELLLGVVLIVTAAVLAWRYHRLSRFVHSLLVVFSGLAAFAAIVLAVGLHILNGATHPWLLPGDPFDEGVDLDSLLPAIQLVIFVVSIRLLQLMRRRGSEPQELAPRAATDHS